MAAVTQLAQSSSAATTCSTGHSQASTAPVLEFMCLFTHDLRRKQKRWQDGRIKFHTFNKRIMVYDERGNFVGDNHWREDYDFDEGEELQLERGGVIVQVAECVGSRNQDLSELIDKRVQEKAKRQSAAAARHPVVPQPGPASVPSPAARPHFQLRHTPLLQVIGTPTGHHGRALIPTESPFEQRQRSKAQEDAHDEETPRPAKRRKREASPPSKSGYAQSLFGATLTLSGQPMSSAPVRHRPKSLQVHRVRDETASSLVSSKKSDDDDVREVSPPVAQAPRVRPTPLIERRPAPSNLSRKTVDLSMEKNARPKPDLHHARNSGLETNSTAPRRQLNPQTDDDVVILEEPGQHINQPRKQRSKSSTKNSGETILSSASPGNNKTPSANVTYPSLKERPCAKETGGSDGKKKAASLTRLDQATGCSKPHSEKPKRPDKSSRPELDSKGPGQARDEPTTNAPSIELRIKPRKKRGLLMVSDTGTSKKPRTQAQSGTDSIAGDSGSSSQATASDGGPRNQVSRGSEDPASRRPNHRGRLADAFDHDSEGSGPRPQLDNDVSLSKPVAEKSQKHSAPNKSKRQPKNSRAAKAHISSDHDQQPDSFLDDMFEQTISKNQKQKTGGSRAQGSTDELEDTSCETRASKAINTRQQSHEPGIGAVQQSKPDRPDTEKVTGRRRSERLAASTEISFQAPETLSHPRLASLSRKSTRSKEVIGLNFDDDEPNIQINAMLRHNAEPESTHAKENAEPFILQLTSREVPQPSLDQHPSAAPGNIGGTNHLDASANQVETATEKLPEPKESGLASAIQSEEGPGHSATLDQRDAGKALLEPQQPDLVSQKGGTAIEQARRNSDMQVNKETPSTDATRRDTEKEGGDMQPAPKRFNPATRGKKAAQPSDAAGKVPENPLPKDAVLGVTRQPSRTVTRTVVDKPMKEALVLPGFSKANGGPWSREAYDLFEFTRPA